MSNEKLGERIASIEKTLEHHEKQLDEFKENDKVLTRFVTLYEVQIEENKRQNETMNAITDTLKNVNDNLSTLNNTVTNLDSRVSSVESEIQRDNEATSINLTGISKKIIFWIVSFIGSAITLYALFKLGLK